MRCGQECPCCSGSMNGENCHAMMIVYGEDWKITEVDGGGYGVRNWCDPIIAEFGHMFDWDYGGIRMGDYDGDPCHLNIVKYLIKYDECRKLCYGEII